jgi:hypothetical protein
MKHIYLLLLLTIFSGSAQASTIEIIEQFDDLRLVAFVNEGDIQDYPLWHPLKEAPPLSISSAIQAINDLYKVNKTELMVESIKEIELRKLPHYEKYWHYLVKVKSNDMEKVKYQVYVVLMNGKVIPALLETESYK